jgi:hypothetical protein
VARKTGRVVAIELLEYGNDTRLRSRSGNPQALSHDAETDENPRGGKSRLKTYSLVNGRNIKKSVTISPGSLPLP